TNPPIDPIREDIVMSLETDIGREGNLLGETPEDCKQLHLKSPVLSNAQLDFIKKLDRDGFRAAVVSTLFEAGKGPSEMDRALNALCKEAARVLEEGATMIILSDRGVSRTQVPIPSLLATGAVH